MFKKLFTSPSNGNDATPNSALVTAPANHGLGVIELEEEGAPRSARVTHSEAPVANRTVGFDQIYKNAAVKLPGMPYGIRKAQEMADSPHLAGMTPESKRCALLMALDAAGADIEDLLQDAVIRQRVLNDYEEKQQGRLRDFEAAKREENRAIQAELDNLTGQYMVRIQANLDEIARQQDDLDNWRKRKQQECQRMTDTAALLVQEGTANHNSTLTVVLERAAAAGTRR